MAGLVAKKAGMETKDPVEKAKIQRIKEGRESGVARIVEKAKEKGRKASAEVPKTMGRARLPPKASHKAQRIQVLLRPTSARFILIGRITLVVLALVV
mmetsp:Transcript_45814/g.85510  ORF Transcript_45814/g.85510 Transcript_45814/m.85510 type:complete len:98 (-) Transcript_45814:511-804(-)